MDYSKTPSPGRHATRGPRQHSPWTAPRARKKTRGSPPRLPEDALVKPYQRPTSLHQSWDGQPLRDASNQQAVFAFGASAQPSARVQLTADVQRGLWSGEVFAHGGGHQSGWPDCAENQSSGSETATRGGEGQERQRAAGTPMRCGSGDPISAAVHAEAQTPSPDMPAPGLRPDDTRGPVKGSRKPKSGRASKLSFEGMPSADFSLLSGRPMSADAPGTAPGSLATPSGRSSDGGTTPAANPGESCPRSAAALARMLHPLEYLPAAIELAPIDEEMPASTSLGHPSPENLHGMDGEESSPEFMIVCPPSTRRVTFHATPAAGLLAEGGNDGRGSGNLAPRKAAGRISNSGKAAGLTTFDDRLHEAVQRGDAVTLGQAWQDVRHGAVQPPDIDSLNALLRDQAQIKDRHSIAPPPDTFPSRPRSYCRVDEGNPKEAEEVVLEACRGGRIQPNSATYHHLAGLWTRHEQLHS